MNPRLTRIVMSSVIALIATWEFALGEASAQVRPGDRIRLADPATLTRKLGLEWKDLDRHIADAVARPEKPLTKTAGDALAAHLLAARDLVVAGDLKQAREVLAKAQAFDATLPEVEFLQGVILFHADDPKAEDFWRAWHKRHPDDFFARNYLALLLRESGGDDWQAKQTKAYALAVFNAKQYPNSLSAQVTRIYTGLFRNITDKQEKETLVPKLFNEAYALSRRLDDFNRLDRKAGDTADTDPIDIALSLDEAYILGKLLAALPSADFPEALSVTKSLFDRAVETPGPFQRYDDTMKMLSSGPHFETKSLPKRTK